MEKMVQHVLSCAVAAAIWKAVNTRFTTYSVSYDNGGNKVVLMSEKMIVVLRDH